MHLFVQPSAIQCTRWRCSYASSRPQRQLPQIHTGGRIRHTVQQIEISIQHRASKVDYDKQNYIMVQWIALHCFAALLHCVWATVYLLRWHVKGLRVLSPIYACTMYNVHCTTTTSYHGFALGLIQCKKLKYQYRVMHKSNFELLHIWSDLWRGWGCWAQYKYKSCALFQCSQLNSSKLRYTAYYSVMVVL